MVNHSDRIVDIFETMRRHRLEPKRCRLVQARPHMPPYIALVEGVKEGKPYMHWESTLCIYDAEGNMNQEINRIYHQNGEKDL